MASLNYWLWLSTRKGLSGQGVFQLLERFGTPEAVHFADPDEYDQLPFLTPQTRSSLRDKSMDMPQRILDDCQRLDQRILTLADAAYPERLRNIYDPPAVLYLQGRELAIDDQVAIGLIGTRKPSAYGVAQARRLGHDLTVQGALVVSGLARGLDSEGMDSALRAGGSVCAVLGCGVDVIYPKENRFLYQDVAAAGLLISEYPPGTEPRKEHFPARNRIISGLSLGVVVVEGGYTSGTSITAHAALDQGRDVFAVPGPIDAPMSYMPNQLIRRGEAQLITSASDILEEYKDLYPAKIKLDPRLAPETPAVIPGARPRVEAKGAEGKREELPAAQPPPKAPEEIPSVHWQELTPALTDDQRDVMLAVRDKAMVLDEIIEATQIPARRCSSAVTILQLGGFLKEETGKRFAATVRIRVDTP